MLVQIDYELRFEAPFHLGTGVTAGEIDRTVTRDAQGYLYVPASTLKGVIREHCEQLCRFYLPGVQVDNPHNAYEALTHFGKDPSLIARIFGSPVYATSLRFDNATLEESSRRLYETSKELQVGVATQVRIDRQMRIAVEKALYTSEFGVRDLAFHGTIKGALDCIPAELLKPSQQDKPTPTYSLLLLLAGLLMVERLGGNKSAGKGQCRCSILGVKLDKKPCTDEQWESWIERLDEALTSYEQIKEGGKA